MTRFRRESMFMLIVTTAYGKRELRAAAIAYLNKFLDAHAMSPSLAATGSGPFIRDR